MGVFVIRGFFCSIGSVFIFLLPKSSPVKQLAWSSNAVDLSASAKGSDLDILIIKSFLSRLETSHKILRVMLCLRMS